MSETGCVPTYQSLLEHGIQQIYAHSDSPRIDAEVLLQHVLDKPLAWLLAHGDKQADAQHIKQFFSLIERRAQGHPIAYLTGSKEFWSLNLAVNSAVLIPRPDTETLVDAALTDLSEEQRNAALDILDLGTGSGAIALALARELPRARVLATDAHRSALDVAKGNATRNRLTNVTFLHSDWYAELGDACFDLIAANPPYLSSNDPHLQQGDLRFEPDVALISPHDALHDLSTIINGAVGHLRDYGRLLVEHGAEQAEAVAEIFQAAGFEDIQLHRDLNLLPRVSSARLVQ